MKKFRRIRYDIFDTEMSSVSCSSNISGIVFKGLAGHIGITKVMGDHEYFFIAEEFREKMESLELTYSAVEQYNDI